jgi:hypothetical protein
VESAYRPEVVHLAVACKLGPEDDAVRMQRWEALSAKGRVSARRRRHLLEVRYQAEPGLREELQALAAAERQCCSFADWKVTQEKDHVVLQVRADPGRPDDIAVFAALFRAD